MGARAAVVGASVCGIAGAVSSAGAQTYEQFKVPLPMIQRSVIPNVEGRMGRLAVDPKSGLYYVAAMRDGSLQVMDKTVMKVEQVVPDLPEPQGVLFLTEQRKLAVSCGDGGVRILKVDDAGKLTPDREVRLGGEADVMRYDPQSKRFWVVHGKFVSSVDPTTGEKSKPITLPAMSEGLAVEEQGARVFVTAANEGKVFVVDKAKNEIVSTWDIKDLAGTSPLAIDEVNQRLFVVARNPGRVAVLDASPTGNGKEIGRMEIGDDADEAWWDSVSKRLYISCGGGGGEVAMIKQEGADKYIVEHRITTATGCRTSLIVPSQRRYIVIAPKSGDTPTFVFIYMIPSS
jgi:DNA-binding beta-propeller fold protein YncE